MCDRHERGEWLIELCEQYELVVVNKLFSQHPRRLYTWRFSQHISQKIVRNQMNFILINHRFRNSGKCAQTYPGAGINSDHNQVDAVI